MSRDEEIQNAISCRKKVERTLVVDLALDVAGLVVVEEAAGLAATLAESFLASFTGPEGPDEKRRSHCQLDVMWE